SRPRLSLGERAPIVTSGLLLPLAQLAAIVEIDQSAGDEIHRAVRVQIARRPGEFAGAAADVQVIVHAVERRVDRRQDGIVIRSQRALRCDHRAIGLKFYESSWELLKRGDDDVDIAGNVAADLASGSIGPGDPLDDSALDGMAARSRAGSGEIRIGAAGCTRSGWSRVGPRRG